MMQRGEHQEFIRPDDALLALGRQRYGDFKRHSGDAVARVLYATGIAKRMLAVDKELATVAIRRPCYLFSLTVGTAERYARPPKWTGCAARSHPVVATADCPREC